MTSTEGSSHAPRSTIASWPVSLPAIAKWLDASASVSRPVSGDLATTANFALVVSGVPTSGENTNINGACGSSGSTPAGQYWCISHVPRPAPPMYERSTCSSIAAVTPEPVLKIHDERLPEIAAGWHVT